jgi:hypothetical protein
MVQRSMLTSVLMKCGCVRTDRDQRVSRTCGIRFRSQLIFLPF